MEIKHINDCWTLIRATKTITDVKNLLDEFPRWSGDWDIEIETEPDGECHYVVYNNWYDSQCETWDSYSEELDIEVEDEE